MFSRNYTIKLKRLIAKLRDGGFDSLLSEIREYISYHLNEKWEFVYFESTVENFSFRRPNIDSNIDIRRATQADIKQIEKELYPHFTHKQDFDKKYISQIGEQGIDCFLATVDNQIVHYFMLFENALESPLMITPFKKGLAKEGDAYLGNAFTIPKTRGYWILPIVLSEIFTYLKSKKEVKRAILLVHTDTPSATDFFQRIGFKIMENAAMQPLIIRIIRVILKMINSLGKTFYSILTPFIEPIIFRLDEGISIDQHTILCDQLEEYIEKDLAENKEFKNEDIKQILVSGSEDQKSKLEIATVKKIIESSILNNKKSVIKISDQSLSDLLNGKKEDHSLHRLIFLLLENLALSKKDILRLNDMLIKTVPIDEWTAPKQIVFGRSFLLMSLLSSYRLSPNPSVKEYLETVSERILRIFEIKQQNIINFSGASINNIESLIEQLRLIYFFLILSNTFDDKRFLNASLKANDRVLFLVKSMHAKKEKQLESILVFSYYLHNIQLQESQMRNLI